MHLIVVGRDLSRYQHQRPSLGANRTCSVPLARGEPGVYRPFADFAISGESLTLGVDLSAPGYYEPRLLSAPTDVSRPDDYAVMLNAGVVTAGVGAMLVFRITRGGQEVLDLEPYLGALGHLVALRKGDLAYLHVHPVNAHETANAMLGSRITFHTRFPSTGRYRLFLQFVHEGRVHTAAFPTEDPS